MKEHCKCANVFEVIHGFGKMCLPEKKSVTFTYFPLSCSEAWRLTGFLRVTPVSSPGGTSMETVHPGMMFIESRLLSSGMTQVGSQAQSYSAAFTVKDFKDSRKVSLLQTIKVYINFANKVAGPSLRPAQHT